MKLSLLLFAAATLAASPALAHPGGHGGGYAPAPAEPTPTPTPSIVPATFAELVAALRQRADAAAVAIDAAKIVDLHRNARELEELGAAIPDMAKALPAEAQTKARSTATHLLEQVAAMTGAADSGDLAAAKAALALVAADVDVLAALSK